MVSTSMLLINKVSFTLEASGNDHTLAGIRTLFRFYNSAGNAVRYFCVANVPKDLGKQDPTCLDGLKLLETVDGMLAAQMVAREHQGKYIFTRGISIPLGIEIPLIFTELDYSESTK